MVAGICQGSPSAIFFIAGGLTSSGWDELETIWPYFAVGFVFAALLIRPLDRLALGDDVAASLGSRPQVKSPQEMSKWLATEKDKWAKVVKASGYKIE